MKKLLLTLTLPFAASAIEVGDCINLDRGKPDDPEYLHKVDSILANFYEATNPFSGTTRMLPKKYRFVKVDCPSEERIAEIRAAAKSFQIKIIDDMIAQEQMRLSSDEQAREKAQAAIDKLNQQKAALSP